MPIIYLLFLYMLFFISISIYFTYRMFIANRIDCLLFLIKRKKSFTYINTIGGMSIYCNNEDKKTLVISEKLHLYSHKNDLDIYNLFKMSVFSGIAYNEGDKYINYTGLSTLNTLLYIPFIGYEKEEHILIPLYNEVVDIFKIEEDSYGDVYTKTEQFDIDEILDKIATNGIKSLSKDEIDFLNKQKEN